MLDMIDAMIASTDGWGSIASLGLAVSALIMMMRRTGQTGRKHTD